MLSQSLERELIRPQTHRSPNGVFKGLMAGLSGRPPDHLSVSQRNLKKQIRSISRPTDGPASMIGLPLKESVYFSDPLNNRKATTNSQGLRKQPLLSRVKKLDRNDEYFLNRLQENRVSMARQRHEKRMEEMQSNRIRQEGFKNIKEMIEEIGRKHVSTGEEPSMASSRCSIFDILKQSRMHCQQYLAEMFFKHLEGTSAKVKAELLTDLKTLTKKLRLIVVVQTHHKQVLRSSFDALVHTKAILVQQPPTTNQANKVLRRLLAHTTKFELLRCFYRFRKAASSR